MELACEESGLPVRTVNAFIRAGDLGRKEAIKWLNNFIERILWEHKDDFPKGISIDNLPRPGKLDYRLCDESRKEELLSLAKERLEKELSDFALKQEGGIESILKGLKKRIDEKFDWDLIDLADSYGAYHNWIKHYLSTEKGGLSKRACMESISHTLGGINELKGFDFNVSGFVREIISKYEKMSPRVKLSSKLILVEDDKKVYRITLKNSSVVPIAGSPKFKINIKGKVFDNGKIETTKQSVKIVSRFPSAGEREQPIYPDGVPGASPPVVRWKYDCECPGYLFIFRLSIPNAGPVASCVEVKATYQEKFLKKEILLTEELKSDNYEN